MDPGTQKTLLSNFLTRVGPIELYSTASQLVTYTGVLFNVDGSSDDPQINGQSWKELLIANGINAPCYVANETPSGTSHPAFSVGGHMTPNSDGQVAVGADSYLMPLCSWHNNKARDGVPFRLERTLMLKLSGFMQGDLAATFMARLPSEDRHTIVYTGGETLQSQDLSDPQANAAEKGELSDDVLSCEPQDFILLKRVERAGQTRYVVRSTSLKD